LRAASGGEADRLTHLRAGEPHRWHNGLAVPALDNTTEVETPERVRFRHRTAGPVRRLLAYILDLLIRAALAVGAFLALGAIFGVMPGDLQHASQGLQLVTLFLLEWGYYVLFETLWNGGTPGKRVLGLRVVKEGGVPIGFIDVLLRNLLRAADFLPVGYALGLAVMAGDRRFQRLGDKVAGTMVVIESHAAVGPPLVLSPPATPGELEALPSRPVVSPAEREAIDLFLRRRDLSLPRRHELAEMIAPQLAARLGVPQGDPVRLLALVHERLAGVPRA
jgi:uncharacterized RDD family membrane protein YckC